MQPGIKWTTKVIYIDITTGKRISKNYYRKNHYITIKKTKNVTINSIQTEGIITYTRECKPNPQLTLELS